MDFQAITIPNLSPDEFGVQITATGQRVAMRMSRAQGLANGTFGFTACAFAVEADGSPTLLSGAQSVEGAHTITCPRADLLTNGDLDTSKVAALKDAAIQSALTDMLAKIADDAALSHLGIG